MIENQWKLREVYNTTATIYRIHAIKNNETKQITPWTQKYKEQISNINLH